MSVTFRAFRVVPHVDENVGADTAPAAPGARALGWVQLVADLVVLLAVVWLAAGTLSSWWVLGAISCVLLLAAAGQYRCRITLGRGRDFGSVVVCALVPFVALALLASAAGTRGALVGLGAAVAMLLVAERSAVYLLIRTLRARGWFAQRTLLVGAGPVAVDLASVLREHPEYGLRPIGLIDDVEDAPGAASLGLPLFTGVDSLRTVISEERVERVIVAFGAVRDGLMVAVLRACEGCDIAINVLPRFFELGFPVAPRQADDVWGYRLIELRGWQARQRTRHVKRAIDAAVALAGLLVLSPLYALLAVAVKISSPGPVHFRQVRVGQNEQPFELLKLRSLRMSPRSDDSWLPGPEEMGRLGRLLRITGFDEIPQLWNVLRGDMSLVGPRPERPFFVERFKGKIPRYGDRHRVPAGLTGLAQVHGLRGDSSIDERARLDNQYIEHWSLWQDVVILVSTIAAVVRNIFREGSTSSHRGLGLDAHAEAVEEWREAAVGSSAGGHLPPV